MTIAAETHAPTRPSPNGNHPPHAALGVQFHELFLTFKRLTSLQLSIWMSEVKSAVMRIVLFSILSVIAFFFVIMAVIFLYAGVFHILTDLLHVPTVWALLIFAGVHLVTAGILVIVAISLLKKAQQPRKIGEAFMSKTEKKEQKLSLRQMEQQRDGEWDHLRAQVRSIVQTVEDDPADWIGNHPYTATGGAALAGFLIAQLPLPIPHMKKKKENPKKEHEEKERDGEEGAERSGMLMALLANLAQKYFTQPHSGTTGNEAAGIEVDGFVTVADGGTVTGAAFPSDFSTRTSEPSAAGAAA